MGKGPRTFRLHFSLRTLLLTTTAVSVAIWYWNSRPLRLAVAFQSAISAQDGDALRSLGVKPFWIPKIYTVGSTPVVTIQVESPSLLDWVRGVRHFSFSVTGADAKMTGEFQVLDNSIFIKHVGHEDLKAKRESRAKRELENGLGEKNICSDAMQNVNADARRRLGNDSFD